jgi:CTP:phosphocholine cytidylyltransferase-like protein
MDRFEDVTGHYEIFISDPEEMLINVEIDEQGQLVQYGDYIFSGADAQREIDIIKEYISKGESIREALEKAYFNSIVL